MRICQRLMAIETKPVRNVTKKTQQRLIVCPDLYRRRRSRTLPRCTAAVYRACIEPGAGEFLHIAGANGSGKTNLVRILCELLSPVSGEVRWMGTSTRVLRYAHRREWIYIGPANGVWRSTYSGEGGSYGVGD